MEAEINKEVQLESDYWQYHITQLRENKNSDGTIPAKIIDCKRKEDKIIITYEIECIGETVTESINSNIQSDELYKFEQYLSEIGVDRDEFNYLGVIQPEVNLKIKYTGRGIKVINRTYSENNSHTLKNTNNIIDSITGDNWADNRTDAIFSILFGFVPFINIFIATYVTGIAIAGKQKAYHLSAEAFFSSIILAFISNIFYFVFLL